MALIPEAKEFRELGGYQSKRHYQIENSHKKITVIAKNESIVRGSELESFEGLNFVYKDVILNLISDRGGYLIFK